MKNSVKSLGSLSPEKRKLLKQLLQKKGITAQPRNTIPLRNDSEPLVASFLQEGLWFLDQLDPGKATYNVPGATRLKGQLDKEALDKALSEIIRRHESLRTIFKQENGKPLQVIVPAQPLHLEVTNLEELSEEEKEAEILRLATDEARKPFDLSRGPLCRFFLIRLREDEHVLVLNIHHIVTDGWSMGVFTRELVALFEAFTKGNESPLQELPIQFPDFAIWQRKWLREKVLAKQLSFWRKQLSGAPPALDLPADRPRPPFQTSRGNHKTMVLSESLSDALRMLTQRENSTLFETLLAAFKILLSFYGKQDDIVVGSPVANRNRSELEGMIGYFVNMLPLRTDLSGNPSFKDLLGRVHKSTMASYAHPDLPFGKLVEELKLERDPSRNPIFQVEFILLTYEHAPAVYGYGFRSPIKRSLKVSDLTLTPVEVESGVAKFDLVVLLWDIPEGISGTFEYNADLFDASTIARMIALFEILLKRIIGQPDARLEELKSFLAQKTLPDNNLQQKRKKVNFQKFKKIRRKSPVAIETKS
ncbi:MAG: condensation domain-containing protein [Calditrichaeota bacterium]|nr:condensation domain-containing protein [Calditrichota bacterium]